MLKTMAMRTSDGEPIPFSITFVTCDQKKNTGGEKITLAEAVLVGGGKSNSDSRNPNHFENYTRNIKSAKGDRILKIHPLLVTRFNQMQITL